MSETDKVGAYRRIVYAVADGVEARLRRSAGATIASPVIILGPPRSGTTLFYQAFAEKFRVSWFCNYADSKFRWPCLAARLAGRGISTYRSDFSSRYGTTSGKAGPAEARKLWSTWFTYGFADESTSDENIELCRRAVQYVVSMTGLSFMTKNPDHCIRIRALNAAFPEAIYIRVKRDPIDVARSILNARKNYIGSYDKWFGVRPPEIPAENSLSATDQALLQVGYLEKRIDDDFSSIIRPDHQLVIDYGDFCDRPDRAFEEVRELGRLCGIALTPKARDIQSFMKSSGKALPEELERALRASVDQGILCGL